MHGLQYHAYAMSHLADIQWFARKMHCRKTTTINSRANFINILSSKENAVVTLIMTDCTGWRWKRSRNRGERRETINKGSNRTGDDQDDKRRWEQVALKKRGSHFHRPKRYPLTSNALTALPIMQKKDAKVVNSGKSARALNNLPSETS